MIKLKSVIAVLSLVISFGFSLGAYSLNPARDRSQDEWVAKTLKKMTLEDKIGQMVAWQFSGNFYNRDSDDLAELRSLIVSYKIGGLILFGGTAFETAHLTNSLQSWARIPLLISSDLERGLGNQVSGATLFPPLMAIGAADSDELAYQMGKTTAVEARAMGIHMTYAPVVDVNINPDNPIINTRSIGEDPEMVSRLAISFIRGCQENGLIATAKHFPGHGDTSEDSHTLLPTIQAERSQLDQVELLTFKRTIEAGVQAVMTAHLYVPALDPTPNLPATLSFPIMTDLLRKELGFKGLLVTDAMRMGGITNAYSSEEAALKSILAGVDIVLLPPDPGRVVQFLVEAARSGKIPPSRINDSVKRILEAKARLGLHRRKLVDEEALTTIVSTKASLAQAYLAFESAATLVQNEGNAVPLRPGNKIAVFSLSSDSGDYFAGRAFVEAVKKRCPEAQVSYADADTGKESLEDAAGKSLGSEAIVFALFSTLRASKGSVDLDLHHVRLIKQFAEGPKPVVVISFGSPYFLRHFPEVAAYICLYRNTPQTQDIAAKAIFGEIEMRGRLPVSLPGLYPFGHGIILPKK